MLLSFDRAAVAEMLAATKAAKKHRLLHDDPESNKPGLWLVGDQGVYLMSNHVTKEKPIVCYAKECDPKQSFDLWWHNKERSFGRDDGVEFLPYENVYKSLVTFPETFPFRIKVTPNQVSLFQMKAA